MKSPPNSVQVQLSDGDVINGATKIIEDMSRIRGESMADRTITDEKKDEYLHLSYRLASALKGLAQGDEEIRKRVEIVAASVEKTPALLKYDPIQDGYWRQVNPRFTNALEELLIGTVRDEFKGVEAKHHLLQAIKYLGVGDDANEREKIFDGILPFQGALPPTGDKFGKRLLGRLFGYRYDVSSKDGLTLEIDASRNEFTKEIFDLASGAGYTKLRVKVGDKELDGLKKVVGMEPQVVGTDKAGTSVGTAKFVNGLIKYGRPISSLILGSLPRSIQERIERNYDYNAHNSFLGSAWMEFAGTVAGSIALAASQESGWPLIGAVGGVVHLICRMANSYESQGQRNVYDKPTGSMFWKPVFYPLEKILESKSEKVFTVEVPLKRAELGKGRETATAFYDAVGKLAVPESVENNLVWSEENHSQFGKAFMESVKSGWKVDGSVVQTVIDRPNQAVIYHNTLNIDGYNKHSSLFCYSGRRYLLTTIGRAQSEPLNEEARALSGNEEVRDKLESARKLTSATYAHLREYRSGKVVNDLEVLA